MDEGNATAIDKERELAAEMMLEFEEIPNASMVQDLQNILRLSPPEDVITQEEAQRWRRIAGRFKDAAIAVNNTWHYRSTLAVAITQIRDEEDWTVLSNADGRRFEHWTEFRPVIASVFGMSERTVNTYLKHVQWGAQVLKLSHDEFVRSGGSLTVGHVLSICSGHDGRIAKDYLKSVRPKTPEVRQELNERYPDMEFVEQLQHYYREEVAHDPEDPSAINKFPDQLAEQAREMTGEASIWATRLYDKGQHIGYEIHIRYRAQEDYAGEEESYNIVFSEWMPDLIRSWVSSRLGIRD